MAISQSTVESILQHALEINEIARKSIQESMRKGIDIEEKADLTLVTNADKACEEVIREALAQRFPDHGILGEEFGVSNEQSPWRWVIDPIDGTAEFAHGLLTWGIILGVWYEDTPVAGFIDHPDLNIRTHAARGLGTFNNGERITVKRYAHHDHRTNPRIGTPSIESYKILEDNSEVFHRLCRTLPNIRVFHSCYSHTLAAQGGLAASLEWDVPLWDYAATQLIIEEAEGVFKLQHAGYDEKGYERTRICLGHPDIVSQLVTCLGLEVE